MKRILTLFLVLSPLILAQEVPPYLDLTVSSSSNFEPDQASQTTVNPAFTSQENLEDEQNDGNVGATMLQIHLIPHTHDDIGWLKTVDQYYYGAWSNVTYAGVQYILDSVTETLSLDLSKRFIYVEMGFFVRWWNEQNLIKRTVVKQLVKNGQLEFINGGWCMNDEAAVYYEDSIDQMTLGHKFLLDNFGVIPQIAWHIDPFGHAAAQAAMYAQMGFKAFYFARIDWQDKELRLQNQAMEMVWQPNTSQGMENAIFTAVNYYMYEAPPGFCFDIRCTDAPIMDDPRLEMYNLDTEGAAFVEWFNIMSESYQSNNLLHTMGSDFQYQAAAINFKNMDKLVNYINANKNLFNVNVFYSTPSQYINDINKQTNIQWPYKYDDFFPYADVPEGYWTGYFTSRVAVKGYTRQIGRLAQTVKKMVTQAMWANTSNFIRNSWSQVDNSLYVLETAMGTLQHHDAVTGTEQQHVVWDYQYYLGNATYSIMQYIMNPYLNEKVANDLGLSGLTYSICNTNISAVFCNATYQSLNNNMGVLMVVYNPAEARTTTMRAKVPSGRFEITDVSGSQITNAGVVCANSTDSTDCDLFWTDSLNPYNFTYYYLVPSGNSIQAQQQNLNPGQTLTINSQQTITVNSLSQFTLNYNSNSFQFNLNYNFYPSFQATDGEQNSGAYIFRPSNQTQNGNIPYATPQNASYWVCPTHIQIQIYYTTVNYAPSFMLTNIRIYNDISLGIEVESFVNSININDGQGKEIVLQVTTPNINSGNTWYTDSMGMEMQTRVRNYRPTWNLTVYQNVSGNYYPIQAAMVIQDQTSGKMFGIGTDRAEGGGSMASGQMEIMIHRRLLYDDARGVGEPLNETDWDGQGMRQWVTHKLFLNDTAGGIQTDHRMLQYNDDQPAQIFFAPTSKYPIVDAEELFDDRYMIDYGPYIKTWQRAYNSTCYLFRFQNMDAINNRTVPVTVFQSPAWSTNTLTEMTLNFNQPKSTMVLNKLNWNGNQYNNPNFINNDYLNSSQFLLRPLEIRTFRVLVNA